MSTATVLSLVGSVAAVAVGFAAEASWRDDPEWHEGKAEWALYDAVRPIYGRERRYEATLFTNKQQMDPETTTKAGSGRGAGAVEVFKHNLSEMIPTEHYTYRFLTTCFVRTDTLDPYKIVVSTQEDCGATYKQFVAGDREVQTESFCYFPGAGTSEVAFARPDALAFHDALSLTLRDYAFDAVEPPVIRLDLVPDQTDTHETRPFAAEATVSYVGRETLTVPYGVVDTHHLRVVHLPDGGVRTSDYWFAADPGMRNAMVQYEGPYGVRYQLKKLGWWAYWDRRQPRPAGTGAGAR